MSMKPSNKIVEFVASEPGIQALRLGPLWPYSKYVLNLIILLLYFNINFLKTKCMVMISMKSSTYIVKFMTTGTKI